MSIIRNHINFSADFVQIPNRWMRDGRLSHRARGFLAEIMTHSDGWEVYMDSLIENGTEGRDAARVAIKELVTYGYLRLEKVVNPETGLLTGSSYVTQHPTEDHWAKPAPAKGSRKRLDREPGFQGPGNPPLRTPTSRTPSMCYDDPPSSDLRSGATTTQASPRLSPAKAERTDKWGVPLRLRKPVTDAIVRVAHERYGSEAYDDAFQDFREKLAEVYGEDIAGYADNKVSIHPPDGTPKKAGEKLNKIIHTAMLYDGIPAPLVRPEQSEAPPW